MKYLNNKYLGFFIFKDWFYSMILNERKMAVEMQ